MAEDENVAYNVFNEKTTYNLIKALSNIYEKPSASNKGHFQNQYSKLVASMDKEVNMTARDFDDTLVCCIENTVEDHIMDFGASFHATYCKEKLERFKLRSDKTLKDVRYIPSLKRRLISVGKLDEEGSHHQRQGDIRRIGMNMLASKGNVPDVWNVDIYFCKLDGYGPTFIASISGSYYYDAVIKGYNTSCGLRIPKEEWCGNDTSLVHLKDQRVTWLSEAEILYLWTRFIKPGASRRVEDQIKNTLKTKHPPMREAPRLHRDTKSLIHLVKNLKRCSPPGDEREVEVLRSFNWPPSELIIGDGVLPEREVIPSIMMLVQDTLYRKSLSLAFG
nr:hypothetical protein [Tanacetum cinerariifolium]